MAENQEGQEKTEQATPKRLKEAGERGQVAKSMDTTTAAVLLFGGMIVFLLGRYIVDNYREFMKYVIYNSATLNINFENINALYAEVIKFLATLLLPVLLSVFTIILVTEIAQVGLKVATKKYSDGMPFKQMNPLKGLKKIFFSGRSLFELAKNFAKVIVLGAVAYWVLSDEMPNILHMLDRPFLDIAHYMVDLSFELVWKVGVVYIVIAVADFLYQKYKFKEEMKMTKQEIKDERKQAEGDPKVKARIRQLMRQRMRSFMLEGVRDSDVIITNPTHFAVALQYKQTEMSAPKVVAKGVDYLALHIREIAEENGVPVVEEPPLARTLYYSVEVNQEIPEDMFRAVAQVLAYVYQLKNKPA